MPLINRSESIYAMNVPLRDMYIIQPTLIHIVDS